ncbi:MAG TPA: polyprenyl synthetase family protein [Candidatus Pristimantibacillus sp.]|jgi:geranylgeranyl diphosphate synthase type I|nr:polyprenyl synthetase family protein [Candidatus Pristimantibacillus sp.]
MPADPALLKLAEYKRAIDDDLQTYAAYLRKTSAEQFGQEVTEADTDIFLDILERGGKRIRGALVMAGYEMCGGTDRKMVVQAARAIEMIHAYALIVDDIQDRSALRRGKPTAHELLAAYHGKHGFRGDAHHAGISLALSAAMVGSHAAQTVLANLDTDPEARLKALSITNRTMVITAHGQTLDILNELVEQPSEEDIERVLEWKTALYTVINPLHVGMVLAGAGCEATDAITPYGHFAGKAFQITDDILGIFGEEKDLGKTPGDDIREGKGTLLVLYALEHAKPADKAFLQKCLGSPGLTLAEFERCKEIIKTSGALDYARNEAGKQLDGALAALGKARGLWSQEGTDFLKGLARALHNRVA